MEVKAVVQDTELIDFELFCSIQGSNMEIVKEQLDQLKGPCDTQGRPVSA